MAGGEGLKNMEGLLKWSLAHSDGTRSARPLSEEDRKWFMEAMQAQTVDVVKRMKEISLVMQTPEDVLASQGVKADDIEGLLEELNEHVESIDMANDLHAVGGLVPLLGHLRNSNSGIRAKAAEVVATMVQNNPKSQKLVMEANGMEPLMSNFSSDSEVTVRAKALGAISSLIRNNKPGIAAFKLANGYATLKDALTSDNIRFQRKSLYLIQYLLRENNSDHDIATELGFPRLMMHLVSSEDADVREAALGGLLELSKNRTSGSKAAPSGEDDKMRQVLESRIKSICSMTHDELIPLRDERLLIDSLWGACYGAPSSLREKGLLVLPGEDAPAPPPDVAGALFEPTLRAWAAPRPTGDSTGNDKQKPPVLGLGPPPARDS